MRRFVLLAAVASVALLAGCTAAPADEQTSVRVYAAASLQAAFDDLAEGFELAHPLVIVLAFSIMAMAGFVISLVSSRFNRYMADIFNVRTVEDGSVVCQRFHQAMPAAGFNQTVSNECNFAQ